MTAHTQLFAPSHALLDQPVWAALTTLQSDLAIQAGPMWMFPADVAPFAALDPAGGRQSDALVHMVRERGSGIAVMGDQHVPVPPGLTCTRRAAGVQMVLARPIAAPAVDAERVRLGPSDVQDMLRLVQMTQPGPFEARTHLLGAYWGMRYGGELVAMAGERLRLPGFSEISAVCVHPLFRGYGLARSLVAQVAAGILARDEVPFLHAFASNEPAIALYRDMGFRLRRPMHFATFEAPTA